MQPQTLYRAHGILQACDLAAQHVNIHLQPRGKSAQRIIYASLSVYAITLPQGMQHFSPISQLRPCLARHRLNIFLFNFTIHRGDWVNAMIIIALNMAACDR